MTFYTKDQANECGPCHNQQQYLKSDARKSSDLHTKCIMCGFRVFGHFNIAQVAVSDCFLVSWRGDDYVGRVDEVFVDTGFIDLNFLHREKDFYTCPSQSDTSLESVGVLRERVHLDLVP